MGTLHVCFTDVPHYTNATSTLAASTLSLSNATGRAYALHSAAEADSNTNGTSTTMTLQADLNKDTPPCSLSPGANYSGANSQSPSPRYDRNMSFFQQLSRRFGLLRSGDDPVFTNAEDDSTDSCSSNTSAQPTIQCATGASNTSSSNGGNDSNCHNCSTHLEIGANVKHGHGTSSEHISCTSSETSSTADIEEQQAHTPTTIAKSPMEKERRSSARASFSRLHRRSTSSIRRAFESFTLSTRSLSCSGANHTVTTQQQPNGSSNTPIKSALKYNSNVELNRKSQSSCGGAGSVAFTGFSTSKSASSSHLSASASALTTSSTTLKSSKGKTKPPPQRILRQPVSYTYLKGISGLPTQRVPRSAVCCQYARR
uniref:DUF4797 domain-containing protein n=1 Tax=Ceratitis capitata TaxID=7213 RepID=W8BHE8_CERCA